MLFGLFKTVLYEKYIILYLTQRMRQWGGVQLFLPFWKIRQSEQSGVRLQMIGFASIWIFTFNNFAANTCYENTTNPN